MRVLCSFSTKLAVCYYCGTSEYNSAYNSAYKSEYNSKYNSKYNS